MPGLEPGHGVGGREGGTLPTPYTHLPVPTGVATDAKMGSELIQVLALDADIGNNSLVFYSILAIHYFRAFANDSEDVGQVFTMGRGLVIQGWPPTKTSVAALTAVWKRWGWSLWAPRMDGRPASQAFHSFTHPFIVRLASHLSFINPFIQPPVHIFIYPPTSFFPFSSHFLLHPLFICPSTHPSIRPSHPSIHPPIWFPIRLSTYLPDFPCVLHVRHCARHWGARSQRAHLYLQVCTCAWVLPWVGG